MTSPKPHDGQGRVDTVNVGQPRRLTVGTVEVTTSIWKAPVPGRRQVSRLNVDGDRQADLRVHGGPDKAVYAYAAESEAWWAEQLGAGELPPGMFGENLTTRGLDVDGAVIGELWRIGTALLQVRQPRVPCYKLAVRFDDPGMPRRFAKAGRPGAYLRVIEEGELGPGDAVTVEQRPDHGVTVADVAAAYHSHDAGLAARLLEVDELDDGWKEWARARVDHHLSARRARMSHPQVRLLPATVPLLTALQSDRARFGELVGSPVPDGWPEFPEAVGFTLDHLRTASEAGRAWSMQFFLDLDTGRLLGSGGFAAPPSERTVEIGYEIAPEFRGRGLGAAAARALVDQAVAGGEVDHVVAHTLPGPNPSTGVLVSLGFEHTADQEDPEVGVVWEWRWTRPSSG